MHDVGETAVGTFEPGISDKLAQAVHSIVYSKYLMDCAVKDHGATMLAPNLFDSGYWPLEPMSFLSQILPFHRTCKRTDDGSPDYQYALVPTSNTLGCSWRWRRKHLEPLKAEELLEQLTDFDAMTRKEIDEASYCWIKPLGIFAPSEGKNRVDFLREKGVATIPARIYEWTYSEPHRIVLYSVKKGAFDATWAVLDDRWVESVEHPSWTIPLLTAYGVKLEVWPETFPKPESIQLALFQAPGVTSPLGHPDWEGIAIVDMDTINAIHVFQQEAVSTTAFELNEVKIDHRVWQFAIAVALIAGIALAALPEQWVEIRILAGMALGAAIMGGMMPYMAPFVRTRRKALRKNSFFPRRNAPKEPNQRIRRQFG
ncbi:hypothetical protein [Pseudomonas tussilaginis]|uniref:hypothetical protein n=1 Tax=Pseudomonas TaxID=286 RepID=UPI00061F5209|nr:MULTISPECIES: hypothetical protein [Pseudomonas]KJK06758.1 hypothetical protein UB47_14780 [Pseudomonas sp. 5]MDD1977311.1 hypothetical protein [Pseudomonas putida]